MTIKLWSILGNSQRLDGGAMFGNAPKALWSRWLEPDELNRVPLACRALLADGINGKRVLFETGIGAFFEPKMRERYGVQEAEHVLLDSLNEAGFSHDEIDAVVLSHLHFDHAGGLLKAWSERAEPELLFPNATFIISAAGWERAKHPHSRDRASFIPELNALLEASGRLEIVEGERSETLGDAVRFHYSHGHTPGLMLAEIREGDASVVFCGDLIPGRPWVHVPITMGYDRAPELLIDEKQRFLDQMIEQGTRLFYTHDASAALSSVTINAKGKYEATDPVDALVGEALG